jgi:hypothetical protein
MYSILTEITKENEEYWPTLLRIAVKLQGANYQRFIYTSFSPNVDNTPWKPEWIDHDLGASLSNAFLSWMERKKIRIQEKCSLPSM